MAKKQKPIPAPLQLVHDIAAMHPDAWEIVEDFRSVRGTEVPDWDAVCYVPVGAAMGIDIVIGTWIAAAAAWRVHKVIYRFDQEFSDMLADQGMEFQVPIETLRQLPYPCVYIDCPIEEGVKGFFVHLDHDTLNNRYELRLLFLTDRSPMPFAVHLIPGKTIFEGFQAFFDEWMKNPRIPALRKEAVSVMLENDEFMRGYMHDLITAAVQLTLYVCAENADIVEYEPQRKRRYIPQSHKKINDTPREIGIWDVGVRIAKQIKRIRATESVARGPVGETARKRPHVRQGHWHHFWTGARDSKERKLKLRWVAPTFVNADGGEIPVKIIEVE